MILLKSPDFGGQTDRQQGYLGVGGFAHRTNGIRDALGIGRHIGGQPEFEDGVEAQFAGHGGLNSGVVM